MRKFSDFQCTATFAARCTGIVYLPTAALLRCKAHWIAYFLSFFQSRIVFSLWMLTYA